MQPQRQNAKTSLPQSEQERTNLVNKIHELIEQLSEQIQQNGEDKKLVQQNNEKIQTLQLRLKLIAQCSGQFSMLRLNHLQQIFKHYCTHVFRIGKHMTFDRLEYDQVHMTIERFFLFLKDFGLTAMELNGKSAQVIEKPAIITLFKKVSSNARQLSFEQFIQCLEKLGVLYYDEKSNYFNKIQEQKKEKMRRKKEMQKRKIQRMKLNGIQVPKSQNNKSEGNQNEEDNEGKGSDVPVSHEQIELNNENDDLVKEMLEDKDLQDPNAQVNEIAQRANQQNEVLMKKKEQEIMNQERLLMLSNEQKIQFYYKIINVDSLADFKKRLTELNLPIFQKQKDKNTKTQKESSKALSESKIQALSLQEEQRLRKIKEKMNEKKEKFKDRAIPKPSNEQALKESQNSKRRKELKKQRQQSIKKVKEQIDTAALAKKLQVLKPKNPAVKPVQYKESQVSWDVLQKISLEQMKMKQFNPTKLYNAEDEDNIFMQQYGGGGRTKVTSGLQVRQRQSLSIVQNVKRRADEVQKTEKKNEKKFDNLTKMGVASKNKF